MKVIIRPVASLGAADWEALWDLTTRYVDTTRERFEASVRQKRQIGLAYADGRGAELVGLGTIDVATLEVDGRKVARMFTADSVIREDYRGRNILQRLALSTYLRARMRDPLARIYWFFVTFSYRSYLLLPRNLSVYWPRLDAPTPPEVLRLMDAFARPLYGEAWDPDRGVVHAMGGKRLRDFVAPIDEAVSPNPHIRFFAERNPRHAEGDGLVCLAPLSLSNWAGTIRRSIGRALWRRR